MTTTTFSKKFGIAPVFNKCSADTGLTIMGFRGEILKH
jgi:hypothetical protein